MCRCFVRKFYQRVEKYMNKLLIFLGCVMSMNIVAEPGFDVIGIAVRTSTAAEFAGAGAIPKLWQQFFSEQVAAKIPHKIDSSIVVVYCDFESDKSGEYTTLIGMKVSSTQDVPVGMVVHHVPAGDNAVFITEKGPMAEVVVATWQKIWALEDKGLLMQAYTSDYELYDERSQDFNNAQVEIHVALKK